jgi:predicted outer membrane repeat protein
MLLQRLFSRKRSRPASARRLLSLEALESRWLPSTTFTFTVDRVTDAGSSQAGVGSGTSGDLRYCIAQANAPHGSAADTDVIAFKPSVFGKNKTIALSATLQTLTISDQHTLTIQGPTKSVTISGIYQFGVFSLDSGTNVTFHRIVITHGNSDVFGGAIVNQGTVTLNECTLQNNQSLYGGGLVNEGGTATLTGCTLANNSAQIAGGILNFSGGTLMLTNCTLYKNSATSGDGGGIDHLSGTATLINCTFDQNSASGRGGGIYNNDILNLTNTLIAFDTAGAGPDILNSGTIGTASHNLIRIADPDSGLVSPLTNGTNGNQIGTSGSPIDPLFDPRGLRNNGGPTQTIALKSKSPAINAGDDSVLATVTTDQRGKPRKTGSHVDIGAYEFQPPPPPPPPTSPIGSHLGPR